MKRNGDVITIAGIDDPLFNNQTEGTFEEYLRNLTTNGATSEFTILLSHRPEKFPLYQEFNIDLILSGHAHGGQFTIPFDGGLVAPNQGFFPEYTAGKHKENGLVMVLSRGLGNSIIPQRIFNRPEVVTVTLIKKLLKILINKHGGSIQT
ncbi:metallophosphoesterase [Halobacillus mangrovi]|uniref:metallophosphoesterase n=1 Tax=Halobacillus mangrovi TaxID=402384 RepID=UPI003D965B58